MRLWEAHVLSMVPFYTVLFPLFLDLLRKRVSSRGDAAMADLIKVSLKSTRIVHSPASLGMFEAEETISR